MNKKFKKINFMKISFWTIFTKFLKNISLIFYFKKKLPKNLNKRRIEVDGRIWMKMDCNVRNWRAAVFLVCLRWRLLRVKWVAMATVNGQVGTRVSAATCTRGAHIHLHLINILKSFFFLCLSNCGGWLAGDVTDLLPPAHLAYRFTFWLRRRWR